MPEHATVLRDGRLQSVPVASIVRGDLVQLAAGDRVPADLRLVAARNLRIEEAALTGESAPAAKGTQPVMPDAAIGDRRSIAYSGTLVVSGAGSGVAVATGTHTELGRISELLQHADELETPLTKALAVIGKSITVGVLALALAIMAIGIWRATAAGIPVGEAVRDMLVFAIALAVGAIPEGLPAIVTIALAIGIQRMAARRAIIRNLPAVETLGSTTVICTDKTGTLTRNEMTVREVWTPAGGACAVEGVGYEPIGAFRRRGSQLEAAPTDVRRLLEAAALCSDATLHQVDGRTTIGGDPTEAALVIAAEKAGRNVETLRRTSPRLDVIPFESENPFMASLHRTPEGRRLLLKGAPEVVVSRCVRKDGADAAAVLVEAERLASHGMRVLAVAERRMDSDGDTRQLDRLGTEFCLLGLGR